MSWYGWLLTWAIPATFLMLVVIVGHGEPKSPMDPEDWEPQNGRREQ